MGLRSYQHRAVGEVARAFDEVRSVLLVAPTGSGKTVMGHAIASDLGGDALWVVHRIALRDQLQREGCKVATVQGLLSSRVFSDHQLLICDEAHHLASDQWREIVECYSPKTKILGLTATPMRHDGRGLGDIFERMVVAAHYSELIADKWLVPCRVFRPKKTKSGALAKDPVQTYVEMKCDERATFIFMGRIDHAKDVAAKLRRDHAVQAEAIYHGLPDEARRQALDSFARGFTDALVNVFTLTEGIDVPQADCAILARGCGHVGAYLQMCGRILRPSPGKNEALLIDLSGASWDHGLPTEDRDYSLDGDGSPISTASTEPAVRVCPECGHAQPTGNAACEFCGFVLPAPKVKIYSSELVEVYAGDETPKDARQAEWERLATMCMAKDWGLGWAMRSWRKLFPKSPPPQFDTELKRHEYRRLVSVARARGYKPGWAAYQYRAVFGVWPRGLR